MLASFKAGRNLLRRLLLISVAFSHTGT
jgi:hypothetical protein